MLDNADGALRTYNLRNFLGQLQGYTQPNPPPPPRPYVPPPGNGGGDGGGGTTTSNTPPTITQVFTPPEVPLTNLVEEAPEEVTETFIELPPITVPLAPFIPVIEVIEEPEVEVIEIMEFEEPPVPLGEMPYTGVQKYSSSAVGIIA